MDLETYYRKIHGMWINIDRCQKQPVDCCEKGVNQFRVYSNTKRLLRFLAGLNEEHEGVRRDILKEVSPPPVKRRRPDGDLGHQIPQTPPSTATVEIHSREASATGLRHRGSDKVTGAGPRVQPPPLTARGANRWTNQSFGAPTAACKSTHGKRASNCTDTQNGGRKGRRREPRWQSESLPGMRRRNRCLETEKWCLDGGNKRRNRRLPVEAGAAEL